MRPALRRSTGGLVGLSLFWVSGCGNRSAIVRDASIDLRASLPTPPCGDAGSVTGTTPIGEFNGDAISVQAYYGADTTIVVYVADGRTGAEITWQSSWMNSDGGAALPTNDGGTVAVFSTRDQTSSWEVPGTVNVTAATDPAASDAGAGGHVEEIVAFAPSGFALSGTLAGPYCTIMSAIKISL